MPVRASRIQEFLAHDGDVTCLHIGRKSAGVLVTGGDDCKVSFVWAPLRTHLSFVRRSYYI